MDETDHGQEKPGEGRRSTLICMLWAGTGVRWTASGGVSRSALLGGTAQAAKPGAELRSMQISDSQIGFAEDPNMDPPGSLQAAIDQIRAMSKQPALLLHTGDLSYLSKPAQFDTAQRIIGGPGLGAPCVPGEGTKQGVAGGACYSFDQSGVHFVGLNNVTNLKAGRLGNLGEEQLRWLKSDLAGRSASQPIVVFAHIPLWTVYEAWGWGTEDGAQALDLLKRFGSITVLNGHIYQITQKVEGNVGIPHRPRHEVPAAGAGRAPRPWPMKMEPGRLRSMLGVTSVSFVPGCSQAAVVDTPLNA